MTDRHSGSDRKKLLIKILDMSIEDCIIRERECQKLKKATAHRYYNGRELNGKNRYNPNPDWTYDNIRCEQMWLKLKINGDEKMLKQFLETTYKHY